MTYKELKSHTLYYGSGTVAGIEFSGLFFRGITGGLALLRDNGGPIVWSSGSSAILDVVEVESVSLENIALPTESGEKNWVVRNYRTCDGPSEAHYITGFYYDMTVEQAIACNGVGMSEEQSHDPNKALRLTKEVAEQLAEVFRKKYGVPPEHNFINEAVCLDDVEGFNGAE